MLFSILCSENERLYVSLIWVVALFGKQDKVVIFLIKVYYLET